MTTHRLRGSGKLQRALEIFFRVANWQAATGIRECVETYEHLEELSESLGDNVSMFMRAGYSLRQAKCYREYNQIEEAQASLERAFCHFDLEYPSGLLSSILYESTVLLPPLLRGGCIVSCLRESNRDTADDELRVRLLTESTIIALVSGNAHIAVSAAFRAVSICENLGTEMEVELGFSYLCLATTFAHLNMLSWSKSYLEMSKNVASAADLAALGGYMYYIAEAVTLLIYPDIDKALDILEPAFQRSMAKEDKDGITYIGLICMFACLFTCDNKLMATIADQFCKFEEVNLAVRGLQLYWVDIFACRMACPRQCEEGYKLRLAMHNGERYTGETCNILSLIFLGRYSEASKMALAMGQNKQGLERSWRPVDYNLCVELASTIALILCIYKEQKELNAGNESPANSLRSRARISGGKSQSRIKSGISFESTGPPVHEELESGGSNSKWRLSFSIGPRQGHQILEQHVMRKLTQTLESSVFVKTSGFTKQFHWGKPKVDLARILLAYAMRTKTREQCATELKSLITQFDAFGFTWDVAESLFYLAILSNTDEERKQYIQAALETASGQSEPRGMSFSQKRNGPHQAQDKLESWIEILAKRYLAGEGAYFPQGYKEKPLSCFQNIQCKDEER